jgi:hypothetical protein
MSGFFVFFTFLHLIYGCGGLKDEKELFDG